MLEQGMDAFWEDMAGEDFDPVRIEIMLRDNAISLYSKMLEDAEKAGRPDGEIERLKDEIREMKEEKAGLEKLALKEDLEDLERELAEFKADMGIGKNAMKERFAGAGGE